MLRHMAHSCHCECVRVCVCVCCVCVLSMFISEVGSPNCSQVSESSVEQPQMPRNSSPAAAAAVASAYASASASVSGLGLSGCQIQIQIRLETRIGMRIHRFSRCSSHASQVKPERRLTETETICCHFGNGKTGINRNFICKCE